MKKLLYSILIVLLAVLVFFPEFISNSVPIISKCDGRLKFTAFDNKACGEAIINPIFKFNAQQIDLSNAGYKEPSISNGHLLGTDELGRDTLAGLIYGFSGSMKIGIGATLIALILGLFLAIPSGYSYEEKVRVNLLEFILKTILLLTFFWYAYLMLLIESTWNLIYGIIVLCFTWMFLNKTIGKWGSRFSLKLSLDIWLLRFADAYELLPKLMVLLVFFAFFKWNVIALMVLLGIIAWPFFYRNIRLQVIRIKALPYIESAKIYNIPKYRIWFSYIMPSLIPLIISLVPFMFIAAVMSESALGFIGLGLGPEDITLGKMIAEGRNFPQAWWILWFPIICLSISMFLIAWWGKRWAKKWQINK